MSLVAACDQDSVGGSGPGSPQGSDLASDHGDEDDYDSEEDEDRVGRPKKKHKASTFIIDEAGAFLIITTLLKLD